MREISLTSYRLRLFRAQHAKYCNYHPGKCNDSSRAINYSTRPYMYVFIFKNMDHLSQPVGNAEKEGYNGLQRSLEFYSYF